VDWIALASVVSSGVVAVATLIINAATKRGDREHASSLEFEKRVWDIKSSALLSAISTCGAIRAALRIRADYEVQRRQAAVVREFQQHHFTIATGELVAYAAESVTEPAEHLQRLMIETMFTDALVYLAGISDIRKEIEEAIDNGNFELAAALRDREVQTERTAGESSGIDVATVDSLCKTIIKRARDDLRGKEIKKVSPYPRLRSLGRHR
jgi:hypothetical protein